MSISRIEKPLFYLNSPESKSNVNLNVKIIFDEN